MLTSIIGESPETVSVSSSAPTFIAKSTWNVAPARRMMSSRLKVVNPGSSAVIA